MTSRSAPAKYGGEGGALKELVEYIAKALVDHPEDVHVTEVFSGSSVVVELRVAPDDMGRVIGKSGRVANAIRALLRIVAAREGRRITLEIM